MYLAQCIVYLTHRSNRSRTLIDCSRDFSSEEGGVLVTVGSTVLTGGGESITVVLVGMVEVGEEMLVSCDGWCSSCKDK